MKQKTTIETDKHGKYMYWWDYKGNRVAFKRLEDFSEKEWEKKNMKGIDYYKNKYYEGS